jgi:hypothetical protein
MTDREILQFGAAESEKIPTLYYRSHFVPISCHVNTAVEAHQYFRAWQEHAVGANRRLTPNAASEDPWRTSPGDPVGRASGERAGSAVIWIGIPIETMVIPAFAGMTAPGSARVL